MAGSNFPSNSSLGLVPNTANEKKEIAAIAMHMALAAWYGVGLISFLIGKDYNGNHSAFIYFFGLNNFFKFKFSIQQSMKNDKIITFTVSKAF
jgi:hypothetical protein